MHPIKGGNSMRRGEEEEALADRGRWTGMEAGGCLYRK